MNYRNEENKILKVLAIGLLVIMLAYYFGKEVAKNSKVKENNQIIIENKE